MITMGIEDTEIPGPIEVAVPVPVGPEMITIAEVERRHVLAVLEALHDNKTRAAVVLGIDRRSLYRRLAKYGVRTGSAS